MYTENPGHETDHQELGPGDAARWAQVHLLPLFMVFEIEKSL
jgi:hypothetical protein